MKIDGIMLIVMKVDIVEFYWFNKLCEFLEYSVFFIFVIDLGFCGKRKIILKVF